MPQPTLTVREFINDAYQLVSASTPTAPLKGDDQSKGLHFLNLLLNQYSASGLMLTVAKQVDFPVVTGQGEITFGAADYTPTPDITTEGRLANLENAWVTLEHVTYPLIDESMNQFFSSYKYDALRGLPRYIIVKPETNLTRVQIFPAPSQQYELSVYGKFQVNQLTMNDDMSLLPMYMFLWLMFSLGKYLGFFKGRSEAWTEKLEAELVRLTTEIASTSNQNLDINVNNESWLNGAWRVRAGI